MTFSAATRKSRGAYGELKYALAVRYANDRDGYTEAKTEFIVGAIENAGIRFVSERPKA